LGIYDVSARPLSLANARHSKATVRWGTPEDIIARERRVFGGQIDLDPCTEAAFEHVVGATHNYSLIDRGQDGLALPWFGRVHCNPPGGLIPEFWRKALGSDATQVIWVGFSIEQLGILADEEAHPLDFSCCILRKRLGFRRHDGFEGAPSHANFICGINVSHAAFSIEFGPLGKVTAGRLATTSGVDLA